MSEDVETQIVHPEVTAVGTEYEVPTFPEDLAILEKSFAANVQIEEDPYWGTVEFWSHPDMANYPNYDPDRKDKLSRLHEAMGKIAEDPSILVGMPYLPRKMENMTEDERESADILIDAGYPSEFSEEQINQAKTWLEKIGLDLDILNYDVGSFYGTILTISPTTFHLQLSDAYNSDGNSLKVVRFLEVLRTSVYGELYVTKLQEAARANIAHFLPQMKTEKDICVVYDPDLLAAGQYFGVYKEIHRISLSTRLGTSPYLKFEEGSRSVETDISVAEHEMMHAWHAEEFGETEFMNLKASLDELAEQKKHSDTENDPYNDYRLVKDLVSEDESYEGEGNRFFSEVGEGVATVLQRYLLYERYRNEQNPEKKKEIQKIYRSIVLGYMLSKGVDEELKCALEGYKKGLLMFKKLIKRFGLEKLPEIVGAVDLPRCSEIVEDSDKHTKILKDPRYIPGLIENCEFVRDSLVSEGEL